jgi:chromosome partitioning protein
MVITTTQEDTMDTQVLAPIGLTELDVLSSRAGSVMDRLRDRVYAPGTTKMLEVRFNVRSAAEMVSRSEKLIRDAEADGRLPEAEKDPESNRRTGYSLSEVNRMREVFGTLPHRAPSDPPAVIAVQNFKGGVGKSTLVSHMAQFFALRGYRVCVIDCDSQASTTAVFGLNPDVDVQEDEDTLYPFFRHGGPSSLH